MPGPTDQPPQHPQAGIINAPQTPFSPAVFQVRNAWQGLVGSEWVIAYAGAQTNPDGTLGFLSEPFLGSQPVAQRTAPEWGRAPSQE